MNLHGSKATVMGTNTIPLTGLAQNTVYVVYFVAEDAYGHLQAAATSKTFTTVSADNIPPTISTLSVTGVTNNGALFQFMTSESGTAHEVILLSGATAPSVTQVMA